MTYTEQDIQAVKLYTAFYIFFSIIFFLGISRQAESLTNSQQSPVN